LKLFEKENVTKDHPKFISRKKKKPFAREKKILVMKEQLCSLKGTTSLMMGLFLFFSFLKKMYKARPFPKGHPLYLRVIVPKN